MDFPDRANSHLNANTRSECDFNLDSQIVEARTCICFQLNAFSCIESIGYFDLMPENQNSEIGGTSIARQLLGKHIPVATYTQAKSNNFHCYAVVL
jgi:hypothetical protein